MARAGTGQIHLEEETQLERQVAVRVSRSLTPIFLGIPTRTSARLRRLDDDVLR